MNITMWKAGYRAGLLYASRHSAEVVRLATAGRQPEPPVVTPDYHDGWRTGVEHGMTVL